MIEFRIDSPSLNGNSKSIPRIRQLYDYAFDIQSKSTQRTKLVQLLVY